MTAILCFDDPAIGSGPPAAGFDTLLANGVGRLNGAASTPVWFHFTDAGEPGRGNDLAEFSIGGGPVVSGTLQSGNHQALPRRP